MTAATQAATITVTGTGDTAAVDGVVTLREAIYSANGDANFNADVVAVGVYGTDTINFNIPGPGVHTITPDPTFPLITRPTVIDGYSQPGASPNTLTVGDNAVLLIELDGTSTQRGVDINASNCVVRGLVINRCGFEGVFLYGDHNVIEGNFIGTDPTGTLARENNWDGVRVAGVGNLIGGILPAARNIISSNHMSGVKITGSGTVIRGNYIGTDKNGVARLGNAVGIFVSYSQDTIIGGSDADDGVSDGIVGARNVISGNDHVGIDINDTDPPSLGAVTIMGNFIGLNAAGSAPLGNLDVGIDNDGRNRTGITTIGGTAPGAGNVISANGNTAISSSADGLVVQGNFIGTDPSGTVNFGNNGFGVFNSGADGIIGGSAPGARNLISGNDGTGIDIRAAGNTVQGNFIGTQIDGVSPLGNVGPGIAMQNFSGMIGGLSAGQGNTIAYNGQPGVFVYGAALRVSILGNSIFSNGLEGGWPGIDLDFDGVTLNDAGDADTGPNNFQNYPVIRTTTVSAGTVQITGSLNSTASTTFRLEFFGNDGVNPLVLDEGQYFLGFTNVTTDASGDAIFDVSFPALSGAAHITATATDPNGNTSEFSVGIGQPLNISTRLRVQTGENVLISGFIITGTDPKRVIVRGIGPSLATLVPGFLADPVLELHGPGAFTTITNNNWRSDQQTEIEATGVAPTNDLESAIVANLPANNSGYTTILRGNDNATGVGVVEAYDLDSSVNSRLGNISTRGLVETGNDVLIAGFIAGKGVTKVIIRAIGPSLSHVGVTNPLLDPTLELHNGDGYTIATNDNWKLRPEGGSQQAEIEATTIPPTDDHESAIVRDLTPGNYTAIVRGVNNTTGIAVVEVYNLQ